MGYSLNVCDVVEEIQWFGNLFSVFTTFPPLTFLCFKLCQTAISGYLCSVVGVKYNHDPVDIQELSKQSMVPF